MNMRCGFCQNPYAIGRTEILAALQHLEAENLTHYDAHCPRCRRATPVLRQKLEMAMPNWREELKEAVKQPAPAPIKPAEGGAEAPPVQEKKKAAEEAAAKPQAKSAESRKPAAPRSAPRKRSQKMPHGKSGTK